MFEMFPDIDENQFDTREKVREAWNKRLLTKKEY